MVTEIFCIITETTMNNRISQKDGTVWTSYGTGDLSRRILLHLVIVLPLLDQDLKPEIILTRQRNNF